MLFWGVEVKPGQTITCYPGVNMYLHLSQASLGELNNGKGSTSVPVYIEVDDKKLVLGTLSHDKCAQIQCDLVFEKQFKLSHGWKDGSIFFVGYKALITEDMSDGHSDPESEEEPHPIEKATAAKEESKPAPKVGLGKQLHVEEEAVKAKDDESDDVGDSDNSDEEIGDEDEPDEEMDNESDEDDGSSEEEEKVTTKKPESGKKRQMDFDRKASVPDKKVKLGTPAKTVGPEDKKSVGHIPTPYPSKQFAKTQANEGKKLQAPKSGGASNRKSRSKFFGS